MIYVNRSLKSVNRARQGQTEHSGECQGGV